jgi:hypothetical protein
VEIETDCLTLKMTLLSKAYDDAQGGNFFREIKYPLEIYFVEFKVLHCPRTCNKVAHRLASMGAKLNDGTMLIWSDVIPEDVIPLVVVDFDIRLQVNGNFIPFQKKAPTKSRPHPPNRRKWIRCCATLFSHPIGNGV